MLIKNRIINVVKFFFICIASIAHAQSNPLGQTLQIDTRLHSFVGNPIWTLIIRDVDNNIVYPYLFDFRAGENHWIAFSYNKNYLITVSRLQIETYQMRYNKYKNFRINNFCNLESHGRIIRGRSMMITIEGDLSPNSDAYTCHVSSYPEENFYTYKAN